MVNKKRLVSLLQQLIRINSQNPPGDESAIAAFVQNYLRALGLKIKTYEFKKRRTNIIAVLGCSSNKHSLLITPHLDTVPAGGNWKINPFSGKVIKNKIFGLGATDCKGNLACAMEAINSIVEDKIKLDYELIFAATADEESGSDLGLVPLLNKGILKPDLAVVLDADDFEIIITQKGLIHLKVRLEGRRAHGAYPWLGLNAIDLAMDIIREIKAHKFFYKKNKYLRPPTVNVGTIKGGDKVNVVADWCEFELDFRFLPGMSARIILDKIKQIINDKAKKHFCRSAIPLKKGKIEIEGIQEPYSIDERHPSVVNLKEAMHSLRIKPLIKGSEGATVITFFQHKKIPAIATGFGSQGCAHTADEYVKIDNLYKGAQVLERFLKSYKFLAKN